MVYLSIIAAIPGRVIVMKDGKGGKDGKGYGRSAIDEEAGIK